MSSDPDFFLRNLIDASADSRLVNLEGNCKLSRTVQSDRRNSLGGDPNGIGYATPQLRNEPCDSECLDWFGWRRAWFAG